MSASVSVLVSAYGPSPYLGDAVRSVFCQTSATLPEEIVLLTDQHRSIDLLRGGPAGRGIPIREVVCPEPRKGLFFSAGVKACQGDVVSFLNDDDVWLPGRLASIHQGFATRPAVALHRGGMRFYSPGGTPPHSWQRRMARPGRTPIRLLHQHGHWPPYLGRYDLGFNDSTLSVRREILEAADPYLSRIEASEDTFFLFSALALGEELLYDPSPSVLYRPPPLIPSRADPDTVAGQILRLHQEFSLRIGTFRAIRQMVTDLAADRRDLVDLADRGVAFHELLAELTDGPTDRRAIAARVLRSLTLWTRYDPLLNLGVVATGALSFLRRSLGPMLIVRAGLGQSPSKLSGPVRASGAHLPLLQR